MASFPTASRRRSLLAFFAIVALAAGLLELAWIAAFTWADRTGRLESWLNRRPEKVTVSFRSARSFWPGLIEVEGLVVRGRTQRRLDWQVDVDRARGQIALLPLARRIALFRAIEGRGVAVRTRRPNDEAAESAGIVPELTPFDRPVVAGSVRRKTDGSAASRKPAQPRPRWTIDFRRIRIDDVREVHLDTTRFLGRAHGEGGFVVRTVDSSAEVYPSRLELAAGEIVHRGNVVGRQLAGSLELAVETYLYREQRGRALLPKTSGRLTIQGELDDRPLLEEILNRAPWATIEPAISPIEADLRLRRGRLLEGSRLHSPPVPRRMRFLDYEIVGSSGLDLQVTARDGASAQASWRALFTDFALRLEGDESPLLTGSGLALAGTANEPELAAIAEQTEIALELGEATLPDLTRFKAWLPAGSNLELLSGSATVRGRVAAHVLSRDPSGSVTAVFEHARVHWSGDDFEGRLEFELPIRGGDLEAREIDLSGAKIRLSKFVAPSLATESGDKDPGWWANLHLPRATARLASPFAIRGDFDARLRDTSPLVGLFELKRDLPRWAERLIDVDNVDVEGSFSAQPGRFELGRLETAVYGGTLKVRMRFDDSGRDGRVLLAWRRLAIGFDFAGKERRIRVRRAEEWFEAD